MRRVDRIHAAIASWQERPFKYGDSDCCCFANYVYSRVDGSDYLPNPYQSKKDVCELLRNFGSLSASVSDAVGRCHIEPEWLFEGDLALYFDGSQEGLGIVVSSKDIVTVHRQDGRIVLLPFDSVRHGWQLGT